MTPSFILFPCTLSLPAVSRRQKRGAWGSRGTFEYTVESSCEKQTHTHTHLHPGVSNTLPQLGSALSSSKADTHLSLKLKQRYEAETKCSVCTTNLLCLSDTCSAQPLSPLLITLFDLHNCCVYILTISYPNH